MEEIKSKLFGLIEEIYEVSIDELPTDNFQDIALYAEATRHGVPRKNWKSHYLSRDRAGFTVGDDLFLELLFKTEKLFNITIADEKAEKILTIKDLIQMLSKEDKDKNREDYFDAAKSAIIKVILIGQDPYPDKIDNGIAFCKDEISNLNKTCFPTICKSLGLEYHDFETRFNNDGKKLFRYLLTNGILFMNLSYELFVKGSNRKQLIEYYHAENQKVIDEFPDAVIIKLGLNYEKQFKDLYMKGTLIVHPSKLAMRHKAWENYWIEKGALLKKFNLQLKT